jgi:hypothetical protein
MVDIVAGQVIRAMAILHSGRLVEAYAEAGGAPSMAGACGLTDLRRINPDNAEKEVLGPKQLNTPDTYLGSTLLASQRGIEVGQRHRALSVTVRLPHLRV